MGGFCEAERGRSPGLQKAALQRALTGNAGFVMDGPPLGLRLRAGSAVPVCRVVLPLAMYSGRVFHITALSCVYARVSALVMEGFMPVTSPSS